MNKTTAIKVTELEMTILRAIRDSEYQDGRDPVMNPVWSFSVTGKGAAARKAKGALSSLVKKGLAGAEPYGPEGHVCWITEKGMGILTAAG